MSAADGGSWKPQQIEPIDLSGHGIAADLRERSAALWALMMGAAKHYRKEANALWPNAGNEGPA